MDPSRVGEFEELVLLAVMAGGDNAYGVSVQRVLEEEIGRGPSLGAIYTALDRLSEKGWIRSRMGDPSPVRGGRRRRCYDLTEEGLARLREVRRIRESLWARGAPELGKEGVWG